MMPCLRQDLACAATIMDDEKLLFGDEGEPAPEEEYDDPDREDEDDEEEEDEAEEPVEPGAEREEEDDLL